MNLVNILIAIMFSIFLVIMIITIYFNAKLMKIIEDSTKCVDELIDKQRKITEILINAKIFGKNSSITLEKINKVLANDSQSNN